MQDALVHLSRVLEGGNEFYDQDSKLYSGTLAVTPLFKSPCDLAERIPAMAADFLELETQIGRRFREDSVTDIIIASLLKVGGTNATVFTPPEVKTGGDFDLVIFSPKTGNGIQYRIQSKRLVPNSKNWAWSSYRELDHPHGSGRQAATLIRSSAREQMPTIPLYALYNPLSVCEASKNELTGIQLADGYTIAAIVSALVKAKAKGRRPRWKRVEALRHLFFPLSTILCSHTSDGEPRIIGPEASREAALAAIEERQIAPVNFANATPQLRSRLAAVARLSSPDQVARKIDNPAAAHRERHNVLKIIERAIIRRPEEPAIQLAKIKRPKLILLSR